jgi:hypothetical protein
MLEQMYMCQISLFLREFIFPHFNCEIFIFRDLVTVLFNQVSALTIKFANSPPYACHDSSGEKPQFGLMTLAYLRFTAMLLLIYGSLFLSGIYFCLSVFWCAFARMLELN